jgi:hypothetical protein
MDLCSCWDAFRVCSCFIRIELQMVLYSTNTISNNSTRKVDTVGNEGVWLSVRSVIPNNILRMWYLSNGNKL